MILKHDYTFSQGEGGSKSTVFGGLRLDFHYDGDQINQQWMIWPYEFITEDGALISQDTPVSGITYARMYIVSDELRATEHRSRIREGIKFQVCAGHQVVAEGVVTKLVGLHDEDNKTN